MPESSGSSTSAIESYQELAEELEKHKESVGALSAKLSTLESVQLQNDELRLQLNQLSDTLSEITQTHRAAETKLAEENAELLAKVGALASQNEILSAVTSVLDRITAENRALEANLETVSNELKAKIAEVNQLREEMSASLTASVHPTEEKSTGTELVFDSKIQELGEENERLEKKTVELEKSLEDYEKCKQNLSEMSENVNSLKTELSVAKEALASSELGAGNLASEHLKLVQKLDETREAETDDSTVEMANRLESLREENDLLKNEIQTLESTHSKVNSKLNSLSEANLNLETELAQARDQVQRLKSNNSELETAYATKEAELSALESDRHLASEATQSLKRNLDKAEEERVSLREQLNDLQLQLEEKRATEEEATARIDAYVQEITNIAQENAELKSRIEELGNERARLEEQADFEKQSFIEQLKSASDLAGELDEMRAALRNWQRQAEERLVDAEQQSKEMERLDAEALKLREALAIAESSNVELEVRNKELHELYESQTIVANELRQKCDSLTKEKENDNEKENQTLELSLSLAQKDEELANLKENIETLISEKNRFTTQLQETNKEKELLRETIQAFQQQREQLVQTVQQKHQEAVNYHTETVRLAKICEDLQAKLNEKSTLEHRVHELQAENEALAASRGQWEAEVERLRSHLLSVEETYTQELLNCQSKEKSLRDSLQAAEERAHEQSRLGDQLSGWQEKYRKSLAEKDRLEREKLEQERSLERLQHALEQLSRERERDIVLAQKELLLKLGKAESAQNEKDAELAALRRKLGEMQQGLDAASRLTRQLDKTKEALAAANEQVANQEKELLRVRQQMETLQAGTDAKVDKSLVKNLLIGYFSAPSAKQKQEVLRIVATVMDFSPEDRHKTGVEDASGGLAGWASGMLRSRARTSSGSSSAGDADKSLSEAFISFLESESARPSPPRLPVQQPAQSSPGAKASNSMTSFQPGRNEPTILRDVLRDSES